MKAQDVFNLQWPYLLSFLPSDSRLEQTARDFGAIKRKRAISSASDLLRLALGYGFCRMSLRQTAAWAHVIGLADISDVAVLKRLRSSSDWLGYLVGNKLAERVDQSVFSTAHSFVRIVDATVINGPDSPGTQWRVHLGFDLARQSINHIELTDASGGEKLGRFRFAAGELVLADRGYAQRRGLAHVCNCGGHFIVRTNWKNVPIEFRDGRKLDLPGALRSVPEAATCDLDVRVKADRRNCLPAMDARLIVLRKSEAAAERARHTILKNRQRPSCGLDPRSLEAATYVYLLTSLPRESADAQQVLEFYKLRWQIEMAFKRLKSLIHLGELPIRDKKLARAYLYSKLLAALLLDDFTERFLAFSPWGFDATRASTFLASWLQKAPTLKRYFMDAPRKREKQIVKTWEIKYANS